jgi:hypothetical protein
VERTLAARPPARRPPADDRGGASNQILTA